MLYLYLHITLSYNYVYHICIPTTSVQVGLFQGGNELSMCNDACCQPSVGWKDDSQSPDDPVGLRRMLLGKSGFPWFPRRGSKKSKVEYMPMDRRQIKCYWQCCRSLGCWKSESMLWYLNTSSHTMKAIPENNMYSWNKIMANEVWAFLNSLKAQKYNFYSHKQSSWVDIGGFIRNHSFLGELFGVTFGDILSDTISVTNHGRWSSMIFSGNL